MATKKAVAVMGCTKKESQKVIDRGVKVSSGMYERDDLYATPPISKIDFNKQLGVAQTAQGNVKGGSIQDTDDRDLEVGKLYDIMLDKLLPYVNGLYKGNKTNLLTSGFVVSSEYAPHPVPIAPVIGRVERGEFELSAKIFLKPASGPLNTKKERLTYYVWMKYVSDESGKLELVLTATSRYKLQLTNLVRGKEVVIYVSCLNSAGESPRSNPVNFIAF